MDKLDKAYKGSYYTIIGTGGDINEWKKGYQGLLDKENIGKIKEWIEFTGEDMNNKYGLTGDNAYDSDLHFLAFPLDNLDVGKLAMLKLKMQDRWFDDIVDNNASRQGFNPYDSEISNEEEMDESIKTIKGIKRKQSIKEDLDLDHLITTIQVAIFDDGKAYIAEDLLGDNSSGSEYDINIKSPKTIVDAFDEYIHDNFGYFSESLKNEARIGKTKEVKILQGNYGYGWDDLLQYEIADFNGNLLAMYKEIRQDLKDYRENEPNASHRVVTRRVARELKEDLEREFTIFFNREGFEYGSYGAVRVKATNEDEAKEKFYAQKKDDKVTISSIRPTENEDIRKGIRLIEEYENKIEPVNDEAQEEVDPAYAQALRDRKDFNKTREKKVNADLDNVLNKDFNLDNVEKLTLDESLFN